VGRKLRADQLGVFPSIPEKNRFQERDRIVRRELAKRAGLPTPEQTSYENLGNRDLPIFKHKNALQETIRDNQISMLEGDTGSGKSTQIGQYALEMGYKKVIYLEPRVLLADNLADQLERELREQLGSERTSELVGVRHSERSTGRDKTIEIMTPATFMRVMHELQEFEDEPILIVGDEIHEKDFEIEMAVATTVRDLQHHPKWRLVLASATMDAASIHDAYSSMYDRPIPRTLVEGRPHELQYIEEAELTAAEAYKKYGSDHDKALLFTAGKAEIKDITKDLKSVGVRRLRINPLHAKLSRVNIRKATHAQLADGERQAIVSTSAGQSGITIPGLTLVITDGTTRRPELNEDGVPGLFKEHCTQDELIQQAGRAGRDMAGGTVVYVRPDDPAFEYVPLSERPSQAPAQIYHTNISRNVLLAASFDANFYELNKYLIHKVDQRTILEAYEVLYRLGALDEYNNITELGEVMNKFPLRPEFSRVLAEVIQKGASVELRQQLAAILCSVESGGLPYFEKDVGQQWRKDIRPETSDDYIAQLDMFYATRGFYRDGAVDEAALEERNYDIKNTYRAHKTFDKVCRILGVDSRSLDCTPPTQQDVAAIHDYLLTGLFDFAHKKSGGGTSNRPVEYTSVHDHSGDTTRTLSKRGTYKGSDKLVIGMPRQFEKVESGDLVRHMVIENVFPTSLTKLTKHVLHLTERRPVVNSRVEGGFLQRNDELDFGTLKVSEEPSVSKLSHTDETKAQLQEAAFNKPTQTLGELTEIKKYLEELRRKIPPSEQEDYFPKGILTDEELRAKMRGIIDNDVDSIYTLDNRLRTWVVREKISLRTWLSEERELEILQRSPDTYSLVNGANYRLYYTHGVPVINQFNLKDADVLPDEVLCLEDGREVVINYRIGHDTKHHSAGEVKRYAQELDS
jgi:HrpA-like RNA helicase